MHPLTTQGRMQEWEENCSGKLPRALPFFRILLLWFRSVGGAVAVTETVIIERSKKAKVPANDRNSLARPLARGFRGLFALSQPLIQY